MCLDVTILCSAAAVQGVNHRASLRTVSGAGRARPWVLLRFPCGHRLCLPLASPGPSSRPPTPVCALHGPPARSPIIPGTAFGTTSVCCCWLSISRCVPPDRAVRELLWGLRLPPLQASWPLSTVPPVWPCEPRTRSYLLCVGWGTSLEEIGGMPVSWVLLLSPLLPSGLPALAPFAPRSPTPQHVLLRSLPWVPPGRGPDLLSLGKQ